MRLLALAASFFLLAGAAGAQSQQLGPEELVRSVTQDVLDAIHSDKKLQEGDRKKALALAEEKILPHVDFRRATQLAVGRSWKQATPEQQEQLVNSFRSLLVRIYSNAIGVYNGQTMKVLPTRTPKDAIETTVRNQYLSPGRPPVNVEYAMEKTPEGWKIYDITVGGVSLVLTYRAEFDNITRTSGIDGLIKIMQEKNA